MRVDAAATVSPALLTYCFADELVAHARTRLTGIEVPCRDAHVRQDDLGALLFAMAFWDLRERGTIALEQTRKKILGLISTQSLNASRRGNDAPFPLEAALLNQLPAAGSVSVNQIIHRLYPRDVSNPGGLPIDAARQEGVAGGYIDAADAGRGAIGSMVLGSTRLTPNCERIASLASAFAQLKSRWETFQADETQLSKALVDQCRAGINSRREQQDRNDV